VVPKQVTHILYTHTQKESESERERERERETERGCGTEKRGTELEAAPEYRW